MNVPFMSSRTTVKRESMLFGALHISVATERGRQHRVPTDHRRSASAATIPAATASRSGPTTSGAGARGSSTLPGRLTNAAAQPARSAPATSHERSEEHTSELQSRSDLVCRLLLEKKKISDPLKH